MTAVGRKEPINIALEMSRLLLEAHQREIRLGRCWITCHAGIWRAEALVHDYRTLDAGTTISFPPVSGFWYHQLRLRIPCANCSFAAELLRKRRLCAKGGTQLGERSPVPALQSARWRFASCFLGGLPALKQRQSGCEGAESSLNGLNRRCTSG